MKRDDDPEATRVAHRHSSHLPIAPSDPRRPSAAFLRQELRADQKAERWLITKAIIALAIVGGLVVAGWLFS